VSPPISYGNSRPRVSKEVFPILRELAVASNGAKTFNERGG